MISHGLGCTFGKLQHCKFASDFRELFQYSLNLIYLSRAIGCLGEVDLRISDNIKQWELYRAARIQPLLNRTDIDDLLEAASPVPPGFVPGKVKYKVKTGAEELVAFRKWVRDADSNADTLRELREGFRRKLESVKSLRDGV